MKHFLNSRYEYANKRVDDVIASQFSIAFVHRYDENPIFQPWGSKTCLNIGFPAQYHQNCIQIHE